MCSWWSQPVVITDSLRIQTWQHESWLQNAEMGPAVGVHGIEQPTLTTVFLRHSSHEHSVFRGECAASRHFPRALNRPPDLSRRRIDTPSPAPLPSFHRNSKLGNLSTCLQVLSCPLFNSDPRKTIYIYRTYLFKTLLRNKDNYQLSDTGRPGI